MPLPVWSTTWVGIWRPAASLLDHALWLHRPVALDDWVLVDLVGHVLTGGRGLYTGAVFSIDGSLGGDDLAGDDLPPAPRGHVIRRYPGA